MAKRTKKKGNKICPSGIAWAKRTFDKYPSAYANMAASKYCKDPNYAKKSKKMKHQPLCQCGNTSNADGNCDGSHLNK